jgi:GntR family transcriptional repressor for pyruvate dehydrogenase complex
MAEFIQMNRNSLSHQIAEQLENLILSKELKIGEKLPGEIELAEKFGSSRNILREAMTTLKERGLIEVKSGNGAFVAQPNPLTFEKMVDRYVTLDSIPVYEIFEVRMALEVRSCGLAAENADEEGIETLRELFKKMEKCCGDGEFWAEYDFEFHMQIAAMTKTSLMQIFLRPLISIVFKIADREPRLPLHARQGGLEAHRKILKMIETRDRKGAEQTMVEHLQDFLNDILVKRDNIDGAGE